SAFAFSRVLIVNLPSESTYHLGTRQWSARMITTAAIVVLCFLAAYWQRRSEPSLLRLLSPGFTWIASTMFTLMLWYELANVSVALGWGIFALMMLEAGLRFDRASLRLQAYVAGICTFLRLLFVNLNAASTERFGPHIYTIVPLALLFFYLYQRLDERAQSLT